MSRLTLVGDVVATKPSPTSRIADSRLLLPPADLLIGNLECVVFDEGLTPGPTTHGTRIVSSREAFDGLRALGFDCLTLANNHMMDFGPAGLGTTLETCRTVGIATAGAGLSLGEAWAPTYLRTSDTVIAIISVATTFADGTEATCESPPFSSRPGIAGLRLEHEYHVPSEAFEALSTVVSGFGLQPGDNHVRIGHETFRRDALYRRTAIPNDSDMRQLKRSVREAKRLADAVVVSFHSHERAGDDATEHEALPPIYREAVAAGASVVFAHGSHVVRRTERVGESVIFYGLGNFVFQPDKSPYFPREARERLGLPDSAPQYAVALRENEGWQEHKDFWLGGIAAVELDGARVVDYELSCIQLCADERDPAYGLPVKIT